MARIVLQPKTPGDASNVTFDFISRLAAGETLSSASVACTVYSGTDANPSAMVSGAASVSGTKILQKIIAGTAGNVYQLVCTATTSAGMTLVLTAYLAVESNLP